jgi:hypothetical protein
MNIAIDYDETYTLDPVVWSKIINILLESKHNVYCVTKRYEAIADDIKDTLNIPIIFATKSKLEAVQSHDVKIDVWIDDRPHSIMPYKALAQTHNPFKHNKWK